MASSSSSSRSDPDSSSRSYNYDVFLSFRGEDTRYSFVDHLYKALVEKSIITFKDDKKLSAGEPISPSLLTAIEESCIAVIVFSENYADSSWCLEELAYIMKCEVDRGLIVMPIFYHVEPTEVRKQKGKFEEAFAKHDKEKAADKVESWRKAFVDASNNVGFPSKDRPETEFIQEVVVTILDRLPSNPCSYVDDEGYVGMSSRMEDLKLRLKIGSDGVRMVGIWGVGGGGKTTLATSVFMEICENFEGSCIVENVREKSSELEKLQERILSAVMNTSVKVDGVVEGKLKIKRMLCQRKVLVLLDDVNQLGQLEALAGSHNWFGNGSRIIITTRDEHLLNKVDDIYQVKLLSDDEATRLFNKYAFNEKEPIQDYKTLSLHAVRYAAGLPLALKVLGSFLYDKNEKEWTSALDRLKDIPEKEIVEKLQISYDGLKEEEQELFLDIACFFRGFCLEEYNNNVREILEACGFHLEIGIKVLRQKALINIDVRGRLDMHDLVQEMGHFIVRREHPNNPENHSRLWKKEEIMNLSLGDATKKNDTIEAIGRFHWGDKNVSRFCKNVSNMKNLRWLNVFTSEGAGPSFLSNELRYIEWLQYPGISFPNSFQPMKLVVLKLPGSLQEELWKGYKDLPCLKVLQLKGMKNLVSTPDFTGLPCLQELTLHHCDELKEIHPSLGNHTSLQSVCVSNCGKLRKFPTIGHMEKLQTLVIRNCKKIEFAEIQANMESVGERCTSLTSLDLYPFQKEKKGKETSLDLDICDIKRTEFNMDASKPFRGCNLQDGKILSGTVELSNLEELDLSENDFSRLDFSLLHLTRLKILKLKHCKRLVELPELPSSVAILNAVGCVSLTAVGDSLTNCRCLCQVSLRNGGIINDGDRLLESMLQGNAIENGTMLLQLKAGLGIAKVFTPCLFERVLGIAKGFSPYHYYGDIRSRLELPENWRNEFYGFLICAVLDCYSEITMDITMEQVKKSGSLMDSQDEVVSEEERVYDNAVTQVWYISFASLKNKNIPWWDQTYNQLSFTIRRFDIYGFGVRLVGKKGESGISGSKYSSQLSKYTPDFSIDHVSPSSVEINFPKRVFDDGF